MSKRTIIFCFGGRRANLELQLPFIYRILGEHPDVEYHLWDTAKDPADSKWMRGLPKHARFKVRNNYAGQPMGDAWNAIYRHYASERLKAHRFVKLDDDVVFLQTDAWPHFMAAIDENPHAVVSANVINNGACAALDPVLYTRFKWLRMPLLNVHLHPEFAEMSHDYFLREWEERLRQPVAWVSVKDWLSINCIGYDYEMARRFAKLLETPSPRVIAGRHFRGRATLGDEGMVNTLPRIVVGGFTACHLTFGPQERKDPELFDQLRTRYADVNKEYLSR